MSSRRAIVTGGFGTLGSAVARIFTAAGWQVARVDYADAPPGGGDGLDIGRADLTQPHDAAKAVEAVVGRLGGVEALINVAGGFTWETLEDGGAEAWDRMYRMNVVTAATMSRAALPELLKGRDARIVNVGAFGALRADKGMGAYAASKSGVHRLTESLAAELAGRDATVNAVLPSIIDTPANRADMPGADFDQWVKPEAIAEVILFLASPAARSISGALIPVTRGG